MSKIDEKEFTLQTWYQSLTDFRRRSWGFCNAQSFLFPMFDELSPDADHLSILVCVTGNSVFIWLCRKTDFAPFFSDDRDNPLIWLLNKPTHNGSASDGLRLSIEIGGSFVFIRMISAGVCSLSLKDGIASHALKRQALGSLLLFPKRKDLAHVF